MPWDTREDVGLATVPQQLPQSQMPFQAYANYAMGPPQLSFSFIVEPSIDLSMYIGVCYDVCFLISGFTVDAIFIYGASTTGLASQQPFEAYQWQAYQECTKWLLPPLH